MSRRRRLMITVLILITAGLSLNLFAPAQRASAMTEGEDAADNLFHPTGRVAPATQLPDEIRVECPMEAQQIGILGRLPRGWSPGIFPHYPFKFISISATAEKVLIYCAYGPKEIAGGWAMSRMVRPSYSCAVPNGAVTYVICKLKARKDKN